MAAITPTFQYSTMSATPEFILLVLGVAAFAFLILAFIHNLRDDNGDVSPTRIIFSLIGVLICAFAAFMSLVVDVNTGYQTHVLYQPVLITILFVIMSILLFANFIYSMVAPEITTPHEEDYKRDLDSKSSAEKAGKERT